MERDSRATQTSQSPGDTWQMIVSCMGPYQSQRCYYICWLMYLPLDSCLSGLALRIDTVRQAVPHATLAWPDISTLQRMNTHLVLEHFLQAFWQWVQAILTCARFFL